MLERIRQLCAEHGTNLSQLEKALGFANGSLAKSDEKIQSVRLKAIADYFGVTVDWLLTGEEGYYTNAETAKLAPEVMRPCAQEGIQRHIAPIKSIISGIYNNQRRGIDWHTSAYNGIQNFLHWRQFWHKKWHIKKAFGYGNFPQSKAINRAMHAYIVFTACKPYKIMILSSFPFFFKIHD